MPDGFVQSLNALNVPVYAPDSLLEGRQVVPFNLTLTSDNFFQANSFQLGSSSMSCVRSITIDNSDNPLPLSITHGNANQTTVVPAAGGAIIPTTSNRTQFFFSIGTKGGVVPPLDMPIGVLFANYEIPPASYGTQIVTINTDLPTGVIMMWSGMISDIPMGFGFCNGTVYPRADGLGNITAPDMRDKFVLGANSPTVTPPGESAGSTTIIKANLPLYDLTVTDTHQHGPDQGGTFLTGNAGSGPGWAIGAEFAPVNDPVLTAVSTVGSIKVSTGGSGSPYLPPYYALAFIMKL